MATVVETRSSDSQTSPASRGRRTPPPRKRGLGWIGWALGVAALVGVGFLIYLNWGDKDKGNAQNQPPANDSAQDDDKKGRGGDGDNDKSNAGGDKSSPSKAVVMVKAVKPHRGGITRMTTQLAEIRFFSHVQLYAKAAGFLRAQVVDIGDTVKTGEVLAEVYAPELIQQVEQAAALVEQAKAEVVQAEALVTIARAEVQAETAMVKQKEAQIGQYTATRKFREKEFVRYSELAVNRSIDERAADEKQDNFESAKSGELVAVAAVESARGSLARALAEVDKANADVRASKARVLVAEAREANARIYQQYTRLTAPFDGVVTERNFFDGDFIRDAAQTTNAIPVLAMARTDLMRVVVYVPDAQVPYVDRGDDVVVTVQALNNQEFRAKVSRFSNMEVAANRAMRVEIDLPNPSGRLRHGMYGDVTILLEPATNVLTVPSPGLMANDGHGAGSVMVVRGDKARKVSVRVGKDNGLVAEILSGLSDNDSVIVDYSGSIEDGSEVDVVPATVGAAKQAVGQGK